MQVDRTITLGNIITAVIFVGTVIAQAVTMQATVSAQAELLRNVATQVRTVETNANQLALQTARLEEQIRALKEELGKRR